MANFHSFGDFRSGGGDPKLGTVNVIENDDHYVSAVNACSRTGRLTVVDMNATWCGPCKMMKPIFHKLAEEFTDVYFLDVDVDKCRGEATKAGVSSIPAFLLFKGKEQVGEVVGANQGRLRSLIEQNRTPANAAPVLTGGQRLGGGSGMPQQPQQQITPDPRMLHDLVDMGFTEAQARAGLIAVRNAEISQAIDWISDHPDLPSAQPQQPQAPAQPQQISADQMAALLAAAASASGISQPQQQAAAAPAQPQAASVVHDALCNYCQKQIVGVRYKCSVCPDFDMCESCKNQGIHDPTHKLNAITENVRPKMTAAEVELKKQELRRKLEAKRAEEEEAEKLRKKNQELERRRAGHDLQEAKERFEQSQARKADIARKKEAQEAAAAKERIRKLIEQDKLERRARLAGEDPEVAAATLSGIQQKREHIIVPMAPTTSIPIQVRLPDGTYLKNEFSKSATVRDLFNWVSANRTDPIPPDVTSFTLMMLAPRRVYGPADMNLTLVQADLGTSSALILTNRRG